MDDLTIYYVETHDFDVSTQAATLLEYVDYPGFAEAYIGSSNYLSAPSHHTILQLGVF